MILPDRFVIGDFSKSSINFPSNSVDMVFADPPYNIGIDYDVCKDDKTPEQYAAFTTKWIAECKRVLRPTGSLFALVGDEVAAEVKIELQDQGFRFRNWIVWHYTFGTYCEKKFGRCHAHLLYFTKGDKFTFNADAVRIPSDRQLKYKDRRANHLGKIPSDVWSIPRIAGTHKSRKDGPPCQTPEALIERCILVSTYPTDVVYDPFTGSGTTWAVAKRLDRTFYGCELSPSYARYAKERIAAIKPQA